MQGQSHRLADLVDVERLGRVCEALSAASGMVLAVLDPDGTIVLASGWQDICTQFHRHNDESAKGCLESDTTMTRRLSEGVAAGGHSAYKCANGLWDVAFPLIIDGEHVANVFTGQFFYDDDEIDASAFRARARRLGFDETAYLEALARVPVFSHQHVADTIDFLRDFAGMLADMGLSALLRSQESAALQESEERYRQLFEAESDAVFLIDNETGRIIEANSAAALMYGYTHDELLTMTNEQLSAEPEKTQAATHGTPVAADNVVTIPLRIHRKKDGSTFLVEITGRFFLHHDGAVHVAAIRDISARVAAEEALRLSEDKFAKAFHGTPDAILITRARDGLLVNVNDAFTQLTGYSKDEALEGTTVALDLWADPADRDRTIVALQSGSVRELELDFRIKGGGLIRCVYSGAIIEVDNEPHVLSVVHDVTEQRRIETAVRQSEALLRGVLDSMQDAYVRTDPEGRLLMASPSAARMYGFDSSEDMLGLPAESLYADPADRTAMFEQLRTSGQVVDFVGRGIRKDGSTFWVSLNAQYYRGEDGEVAGVEGFIRDITERKQAEEELQQSRALFQAAMDQSQAGIAIADAPDGQLRYVNRAGLFIRGGSSADLIDQVDAARYVASWQILHHDGTPYAAKDVPLARAVLYGETVEAEFIIRRDDHDDRLVSARAAPIRDADGLVTAGVVVFDDITERKRAEEAAIESAANYQQLFDATLNGMAHCEIVLDEQGRPVDYRFLEVNETFEAQTGLRKEEVEGRTIREIIPGFEKSAFDFIGVHGKVALTGEATEFEQYQEDLQHWYSVHLYSPRRGQFISMFSDITERKEIEQKIGRLNAELEQRVTARTAELEDANRELEAFAYSVSHDLRAPLRALDGFSQILLDDYGAQLDEEGRSHLERIRAADLRMGALIDALLELSRLNRGTLSRERLDISEMARSAAAELAEAEPGRHVQLVIAESLEAHADRRLVEALLANLLGNAWKFTAKHAAAHIEVGAEDSGGERAFFVRDDGAGFDMAYAGKLFGAFQRLHSPGEFEGLGIGLATVQRIVRRHGGRVWAEGEVEKGATFYFTLPATHATSPGSTQGGAA